jgi:hypothetical protein
MVAPKYPASVTGYEGSRRDSSPFRRYTQISLNEDCAGTELAELSVEDTAGTELELAELSVGEPEAGTLCAVKTPEKLSKASKNRLKNFIYSIVPETV